MWRQGDILLELVDVIPDDALRLKHQVIEASESTGHQHKIEERRACRLYSLGAVNYLEVFADVASLVHPEHDTIELKTGIYRVWRQREFSDSGIRQVYD